MITDLTEDDARTQLIVEYVKRIRQDPSRLVLVLTHRREHCKDLALLIDGAVAFVGTTKKKDKTMLHKTAPVVCSTYSMASEGYDDPRLNTLVLATPVSDVTQAMGRVTRGVSSTPPVIIDIMDECGVFYAQAAKRKSEYKAAGFSIKSDYKKKFPKCIVIDSLS
jgi:superfamily II DNA or RNA helicase